MNYCGYIVDSKWINDEGSISWEGTGNGLHITGKKDGKSYFIKKSVIIRYPDKSLPTAAYNQVMNDYRKVRDKQAEIAKRLLGTSLEKDRIVRETENFSDEDNYFTTVTPLIKESVPVAKAGLDHLGYKDFLSLAVSCAEDLADLHAHHVIHGDLKPDNYIYVAKGSSYEAYIMDFDIAFPDNQVLDFESIGGTEGYQAPELLAYCEGEGEIESSTITPEIDVFSLAITFHNLWTGSLPECGKYASVGDALREGGSYHLDPKFDTVSLGDKGTKFSSLLIAMLQPDPKKRLTAQQVVDVLQGKVELSSLGASAPKIIPELWAEDESKAVLLGLVDFTKAGVIGFKKIEAKGKRAYLVTTSEKDQILGIDEVIHLGIAKEKEIPFSVDEPFPSDQLVFADEATLKSKNVVSIKKGEDSKRSFYLITTKSGLRFSWNAATLIKQGLASKKSRPDPKAAAVVFDEAPWPEDGTSYDAIAAAKHGFVSFKKIERDGKKAYEASKADGSVQVYQSNIARFFGVVK